MKVQVMIYQYHRVKHLGEPQTLCVVGVPLKTSICVMVSDELLATKSLIE